MHLPNKWVWLSTVAAIAGVALSVFFSARIARVESDRFEVMAQSTSASIQDRLESYFGLLAAMRVAIQPDPPNADEFAGFAEAFDIKRHYPGVKIINYAAANPDGSHVITMVSPVRGNERFLGRDLTAFTPNSRINFETARDTGLMTTSGQVINPSGPGSAPGFAVRMPVYRGATIPATVEGRRAAYIGSIGLGLSLDVGVVDADRIKGARVSVYEGGFATGSGNYKPKLLYASRGTGVAEAHKFSREFTASGRRWLVEVSSPLANDASIILVFGLGLSFALSLAVLNLAVHEREGLMRKQRAEEVEAINRELMRACSLKSEFVANASHELRTPLNAIIGFSELLGYEEMTQRQKLYVSHIHDGGMHLLSVINDTLDLSCIEAGKLELKRARVPAEALFASSLSMFEPAASARRIALECDCQLDGDIDVDLSKARQVIYNLLSNAVKFTPNGGSVVLLARKTRSIDADGFAWIVEPLREAGDYLEITVSDTGMGMAADDLPKLFLPFARIDGKIPGTGLGLVLVKQLVQLHDGGIAVRSAEGAGTAFRVWLPQFSGA